MTPPPLSPQPATLPGIVFRRFRGEADYAPFAEIANASQAADLIEEVETVEDVANLFAHLANCDPVADIIVAEADGRAVGFSRVRWRLADNGDRYYWQTGHVLPEWRRKGIGRALLRYTEARARASARANPIAGANFIQSVAEDTALGKAPLLVGEGYRPVRYFFVMQRRELHRLPVAPLASGLKFRPARPDRLREIWDAIEDSFRDQWGHAAGTETDYQHWANDPHNDLSLWQIAWDVSAEKVAGISLNAIFAEDNVRYNFQRGWINTLGVRREWRGRGVARAMLVSGMTALRERGMTEAVLGVDAQNPTGALKLYESVGFQAINKDALYRKAID